MLENRVLGGLKIANAVGWYRISGQRNGRGTSKFTSTPNVNMEGEMGLVCSMNGVEGKFILIGKSKRNGQFIRPRIDGRIILKWILRYDV